MRLGSALDQILPGQYYNVISSSGKLPAMHSNVVGQFNVVAASLPPPMAS